jgi:hypothetical protein
MQVMPFHRSLLFWFGACGFAFLLWAWWDSMGYESKLRWRSPSRASEFDLFNAGAKIALKRSRLADGSPSVPPLMEDLPVVGRLFKRETFLRSELNGPHDPFPAPGWKYRVDEAKLEFSKLPTTIEITESWELSYWLVIACYLPPWLGLAFWRAKRIARTAQPLCYETRS